VTLVSGHIIFMIQENTKKTEQTRSFSELGIVPMILDILSKQNFSVPTPIQMKAIPDAVAGRDIIGIAQTGTGKTLAFGIPMVQRLAKSGRLGLVVLPTRELALQVEEVLAKIGRPIGFRTAVIIGGASMNEQMRALKKNPHVIIGTPGRINDHLQRRTMNISKLDILVLDEADRMFDMGFAPQIKIILDSITTDHQTLLFSATMPENILNIAKRNMKSPVYVEIARSGTVAEKIHQELYVVKKDERNRLLDVLFQKHEGSVLIFSRTKHGARKICRAVKGMNQSAAEIHSQKTLVQRRRALEGFKKGTHRVLVATDIASRGIDVQDIGIVINYDLPDNPEDYIHRIGRTGRAGKGGRAISFVSSDQKHKVRTIERLMRSYMKVTPLPELPAERKYSFVKDASPTKFERKRYSRPDWKRGRGNRNFKQGRTAAYSR